MSTQPGSIPRVNSVVILANPRDMDDHVKGLNSGSIDNRASILYLSCNTIPDISATPDVWLAMRLLETLDLRTRVGCGKPLTWVRYRTNNAEFENLIVVARGLKSSEKMSGLLSHSHTQIRKQLEELIALERREFVLIAIGDFQRLPRDRQPIVASMIHKLVKGAPAYFRFLSTDEPILFAKDQFGEVGLQRDNDYIEIKE